MQYSNYYKPAALSKIALGEYQQGTVNSRDKKDIFLLILLFSEFTQSL